MTEEKVEAIDLVIDTGRWRAEMLAMIKQVIAEGKETQHLVYISCEDVHKLRAAWDADHKKGRGLWQAIWHGLGVIKAEGDRLFKE